MGILKRDSFRSGHTLSEAKDLEDFALEEERKARLRAEEAEIRERNATAQVQILIERLNATGASKGDDHILSQKWADFEDWCDRALVGRVVLTGARGAYARKPCLVM